MRALLATADVAGQQYDWQATNALRGDKDSDRPFVPQIPDHPTPASFSKDSANKDGSGPDQYGIDKPGFLDKAGLQATRAWAEGLVGGARATGQQYAPDLLQHFLDGSGKPATVPVDNMLHDMSWFKQDSTAMARTNLDAAMQAMPRDMRDQLLSRVAMGRWTETAPVPTGPRTQIGSPRWARLVTRPAVSQCLMATEPTTCQHKPASMTTSISRPQTKIHGRNRRI